jgi:SNF2 family DNA or RNA helicase
MWSHAERVGSRIHLQVWPPVAHLEEELPGASWRASADRWTFALSMDVCRHLRKYFGAELRLGPALTQWARAEVARERSQAALGRTLEGVELHRVPDVAPALAKVLASRPYQSSAARFIAGGATVLVADTPGLGKTTEAIAGIIEAGVPGPYLVCAPKTSLEVVWEREIIQRLPDAGIVLVDGSLARRTVLLAEFLNMKASDLANTWVITNIEMVRTQSIWVCPVCDRQWKASDKPKSSTVNCGHDPNKVRTVHDHKYPILFAGEWGAVIMDECQRSLIRKTGQPTLTRNGARLLRTRQDGLRIAMSGTPMRGNPQRLFGTLNWLRPNVYTGYWQWVERYWHVTKTGYNGSRVIGKFNQDMEAAFFAALDGIMIRRTKEEVSPELPPKQYMGTPLDPRDADSPVAIWLPMEPEQASAYQQMLVSGSAMVEGGQVDTVGLLAELTRLKQFANAYGEIHGSQYRPGLPSNKFNWLVQFLTERNLLDADEEPTGKVVVVSQFSEILRMLFRELKALGLGATAWAAVTGAVTGEKRQRAIDRFNAPDSGCSLMFLNTTAGGVAVTLDAADDMVILDETHVPDDQEQVEDRINNRRQEEKVATRRFWYPKSLGTVDEAIARTNSSKDKTQKWALDGRRGVAYLREVVETMKELR